MAGANGAYDLGLGCRSCTAIGAGLGTATAVDISIAILFWRVSLPEHSGVFVMGLCLFNPELLCLWYASRAQTVSSLAECVGGNALETEANIVQ